MAEFDTFRVAPMFAANPEFYVRLCFTTQIARELHQLPDSRLINGRKRIVFDDLGFCVVWQKTSRIIPAHSKVCLGQIVGSETEKLGVLRYLIRHQCPMWDLNHAFLLMVKSGVVFFCHL